LVLNKTFIITCVSLSFGHVQNRESQSMQDAGSSPPKANMNLWRFQGGTDVEYS
jgi:hypothetical protein